MQKRKNTLAFRLSLLGSIIILLNGVWILLSGQPIVVSTDPAVSTFNSYNSTRYFWGRASFGVQGLTGFVWTPIWLLFAVLLLVFSAEIYRRPSRQKTLWIPMLIVSIFTLPIGGGFLIGFVLALVAALLAAEWPKPFRETFIGRIARAALWNSEAIGGLAEDASSTAKGVGSLIIAAFAGGLGSIVYAFNCNIIKTNPDKAFRILFAGNLTADPTMLVSAVSLTGITLLRWIMLSSLIYLVAVKIKCVEIDFRKLALPIAVAFIPISLQAVLPIFFPNEPSLSINWPLTITVLSVALVAFAVTATVATLCQTGKREALGITLLGGTIFWLVDTLLISSNSLVDIPGIRLNINPISSGSVTLFTSIVILISIALGSLNRKTR